MDDLVEFLSQGEQPVVLSCVESIDELHERLDLGYILVKFTDTKGGTELGFELDRTESELGFTDLGAGGGRIKLVGQLVLDYVSIEVAAIFELPSLEGMGRVTIV